MNDHNTHIHNIHINPSKVMSKQHVFLMEALAMSKHNDSSKLLYLRV